MLNLVLREDREVDWLIGVQRWLYERWLHGGMAETMGVATDASGLPTLMGWRS